MSFQCNWEDSELLFQKLLSAFKSYPYIQATGWEQKKKNNAKLVMRSQDVNTKYFKIIRRPDMTCPNGYLIYCIPPQIYTQGSFNPCFWSKVETVATACRDTVVLGMGMGLGTPSLCWLPREKPLGSTMQVRKSCSCHLSLALLESLVTR